jgi:hypothetical protein
MLTAAATINEGASVAAMVAAMLQDLHGAASTPTNLNERAAALLGALLVLDKVLAELRAGGVRVTIDPATVPSFDELERQAFGRTH